MKKNPSFVFKVVLAIGDMIAIVASFSMAYYYRIHFDSRPFYFSASTIDFLKSILVLIPAWLIIFKMLGLYQRSIYLYRSRLYGRLLIAAVLSVAVIISYEFFFKVDIFPTRMIAVYSMIISFVVTVLVREILIYLRRVILKSSVGVLNVLIIGEDNSTYILADYLDENPTSGYKVCGIIANKQYVPERMLSLKYNSLATAIKKTKADILIQTDSVDQDKNYAKTIDNHMSYMFVPNQEVLSAKNSGLAIMGSLPIVTVSTTPLIGSARFIKRFCDILFGTIFFIITSPIMLLVAIISKIADPKGSVIYRDTRLTRFNQKRNIYKFRTIKSEYSGLTPEQAFDKMGKPELTKEYRANGDQLDDDPRMSKFSRFLRSTSIDELPQFVNVVKGDISLVGPRALQPGELNKYANKNLILSVKSGLTGLAQVSGRRGISFEERRLLDVYYIQNWSLLLDFQIILKTVATVLFRKGAK